jgi:aspartate carbamoyltransferase catalytic subunit
MPKNLLTLDELDLDEIKDILAEAQYYRDGGFYPNLQGRIACNLFFESSTRTQYSFQVAEEKLGMRVISFDPQISSLNKQETFYDTVKTFDSFGVDAIVIRHSQNEYYRELEGHVRAAVLNGGDGTGNHPTQSLLDLLTIKQEFKKFEGLKVAIIGDVAHSRVAHTNYNVMRKLGMEVVISGPEEYMDKGYETEAFDKAISTADVVMLLRIQFERDATLGNMTKEQYHERYGLSLKNVDKLKENAIIMHPAPVNRGIEIADEVMECPKARIFKQMENGVYVRMAALVRSLREDK